MLVVDDQPFATAASSSSSTSQPPPQETEELIALLEHPTLVSASNAFVATPEMNITLSAQYNYVYVFQKEYATVSPALAQFVGTDEATTCVGLVIRNPKSGMTSVSHMDSPDVVDLGLTQMLSLITDHNTNADLDVHLIGGFEDTFHKPINVMSSSESNKTSDGHSFPLCSKIIKALQNRPENFHLQTLFVLGSNTRRNSDGDSYPIHNGFVVETCTGIVRPANFVRSSRCPDEIVRSIRVMVSSGDPTWKGKLLETYDTENDRFQIAACSWTPRWKYVALSLQELPDSEILLNCSTSPFAEGPDFVDYERRLFDYLIKLPNWRDTFPRRKPRLFERTADGGWRRITVT